MTDMLLAKPTNLPDGFIDLSVGEAHIVRQHLAKTFDLYLTELQMLNTMTKLQKLYEYPIPTGYQPLVDLLEKKHGAPVVITNGAKQALGATFYALKKMGHHTVGMRSPYWALIPPLAEMHGLSYSHHCYDSYLAVSPNNPDGHVVDLPKISAEFNKVQKAFEAIFPLIHDAAYYTHTYLPPDYPLKQFGDVQIFSISKMLGLSSLRVGYAVCPNPTFYRYFQEYMESMTVGVSILPQIFVERLMFTMQERPALVENFETSSRQSLTNAKEILLGIDPGVLEVPNNFPDIPGMFLWAKAGPALDLPAAKINAIAGDLFGQPGFIRMNIAFDTPIIQDIVYRLNSSKRRG